MNSQRWTLTLDDKAFDSEHGDNLLSSLLSQDVNVRYGCRAGACGACQLYDLNHQEPILSCQTTITSNMKLSSQPSFHSAEFKIESLNRLNESNIEVILLGPSDDAFGDRVIVSVTIKKDLENKEPRQHHLVECMALNQAGAPLKIILQQSEFTKEEWEIIKAFSINDSLSVQTLQGVRKGRLLHEMNIDNNFILVVSSSSNSVFKCYWRDALKNISDHKIEHFQLAENGINTSFQDSHFESFLNRLVTENGTALHIIYHGQYLSEKEWEQMLRPLRIRTNQLHFIR